jgi:hypothetical protein
MIIGIAGPSGSGKTFTALTLAMGLAGEGGSVALIDTEGRRALHYADNPLFRFDHCDFEPPYTPARLLAALQTAEQAGYAVIVMDSFSDEYVGEGGLVDMAFEEEKRIKNTAASWARPKAQHKLVVRWMRQSRCHLIFALRAEEKVRLEKIDGKTVVVPIGWQPICEKNVPYEMATSFMLTPEAPGVPRPIKIQEQHRAFFPTDRPVTRETGRQLAEWCAGGVAARTPPETAAAPASALSRPDLMIRGAAAASRGSDAYRDFWAVLKPAERRAIGVDQHGFWKQDAVAADELAEQLDAIDELTEREPEEMPI